MHPIDTKDKAQGLHNLTSGDSLEILCKGICYALPAARSGLRFAAKSPHLRVVFCSQNLAPVCITPFGGI